MIDINFVMYILCYYDHVTCMYNSGGGALQVVEGSYSCSAQTHGLVIISVCLSLSQSQRGILPVIVYSGCHMSFYEYIRENIFKRNKHRNIHYGKQSSTV